MEQMNPKDIPMQDAQWPSEYAARDEISLFDLWAVLIRRKWTIAAVWLLTAAVAALYAFATPDQYRFSMPVEIGSKVGPDQTLERIEPPQAVVAKFEKNYIPLAISAYLEKQPAPGWTPKITASAPESSDIVVLEAEGSTERREAYSGLFQSVVDALVADHTRVTRVEKAKLTSEIETARNRVSSAQDEIARLEGELTRLDKREGLIDSQIEALTKELAALRDQRQGVAEQMDSATSANVMAMLTSDINSLTERLAQLRESRLVELPAERARLESAIRERQRAVENLRGEISALEARKEVLSPTHSLSAIQRSVFPTGPGDVVILALGAILGLMLGVFAAFAAEFVVQANHHARNGSASR